MGSGESHWEMARRLMRDLNFDRNLTAASTASG